MTKITTEMNRKYGCKEYCNDCVKVKNNNGYAHKMCIHEECPYKDELEEFDNYYAYDSFKAENSVINLN